MPLFDVTDFLFNYDMQSKALVQNTYLVYSIIICYVLFVQWIGPAIMKNRKPYNLKYTMIVYNFTQSCLNAYVAYQIFLCILEYRDEICLIKHSSRLPSILKRKAGLMWQLYLIKFMDLLDTVFFVLRKKQNQVSFLHVFHHSCMCLIYLIMLRNIKHSIGFYIVFTFEINTSIHVVMYFYYGLSAFGPHMQRYLWWKKYITVAQIGQFVFLLGYMPGAYMIGCEEFGQFEIAAFIYSFVLLLLFLNFFRKYKKE